MSFSESICSESEDVDVDVDVDVPPHVQELVATDNSRFEDWVMQVKAFRVRWFGSSDMVTGNHGNNSPLWTRERNWDELTFVKSYGTVTKEREKIDQ